MSLRFICPADDCQALNFGHGSVVCVCNATHCDSVGRTGLPDLGQFLSYVSSKTGSRLMKSQGQFQKNSTGAGERLKISLSKILKGVVYHHK